MLPLFRRLLLLSIVIQPLLSSLEAQSAFCDMPVGSAQHAPAYQAAQALPVYREDPFDGERGMFTADVVIKGTQLIPFAMTPPLEGEQKAATLQALARTLYESATYDGDVVPAYFRAVINDFFYLRKPDDLTKLPEPRFVIGADLKRHLNQLLDADRLVFKGDGRLELRFKIDEQGSCTKVSRSGEDSQKIGDAFNQLRQLFPFQPAEIDGQPVPCELILVIQEDTWQPKERGDAPDGWDDLPLPTLPVELLQTLNSDVTTVFSYEADGVKHIWFPGVKDPRVAAYLASTLRDWQPPKQKGLASGLAKTCFAFDQETGAGVMTQKVTRIIFQMPVPQGRPDIRWPRGGRVYENGMLITKVLVTLRYVVKSDGTVGEIRVEVGHPVFTEEVVAALQKMKFEPATFDGKPVNSWVRQSFPFQLR